MKHLEQNLEGHGFRFVGEVEYIIRRAATGKTLKHFRRNLITDVGLDQARDLLGGGNYSPTHIAVGTGATAPAVTDTTLDTEVFRNSLTQIDKDPGSKVQFLLFLDSGDANGNLLAEAGLFNSAAAGNMFSRVLLIPTINKDALITVTLSWTITVARA